MPRPVQRRLVLAAPLLFAAPAAPPASPAPAPDATAPGAAAGAVAPAAIPLVAAGPLTGNTATVGEQMRRGVDQAVADLNAAGGVLGRVLRAQVHDDACDPKQAVAVANLIATRRVRFVVGHACSGASIPASAVYAEEGILMISPASSNPALTDEAAAKGWNTILRLYARDDAQGDFTGRWLAAHRPGARVAVVDDQTAYGRGLAERVRASLAAAAPPAVLDGAAVRGERDFGALVARLKQARVDRVDLIYFGGYPLEAGLLLRQAREQGLGATLMGGDTLVTPDFWNAAGSAGEGTLMTFPPEPRANPAARAAVARLRAAGFDPGGCTLYSYAAVQALAEGIARAGRPDPARVAAALRGGAPVPTVLGPVAFDAKGDVRDPRFAVYTWRRDGRYAELPQGQPP